MKREVNTEAGRMQPRKLKSCWFQADIKTQYTSCFIFIYKESSSSFALFLVHVVVVVAG